MNFNKLKLALVLATIVSVLAVVSAQQVTPTPSDYVDLQFSEIRGIAPDVIESYQAGSGLGYALPAELNGYPGPRHVLDLVMELELTDEQEVQIQALYDVMLPQAIALGEQYLAQEEAIELAFREGTITNVELQESLAQSAATEGELRFVHLATHLQTIDILTEHQVRVYNQLRGYEAPTSHDGNNGTHSGHSG